MLLFSPSRIIALAVSFVCSFFVSFLGSTIVSTAFAGPNQGGVLLVHTDDSINYTLEQPYVGGSGLECPEDWDCPPYDDPECTFQMCSADPTSDRGDQVAVWWVLLAFPGDGSQCPRVQGVTFAVDYNPADLHLVDWGTPAPTELHDESWPEPTTGTALVFNHARRSTVLELYWFAGWAPYGNVTFSVIPHARRGGEIADDSVPAVIDPIRGYGRLGLGGETGWNPDCGAAVPVVERSWGQIKASYE